MWEISWLSAFVFVLLFAFLPETATPTLLYYKAKRLRQDTGNPGYRVKGSSDLLRGDVIKMALIKPFEITVKDPAIAFTNLYVRAGPFPITRAATTYQLNPTDLIHLRHILLFL